MERIDKLSWFLIRDRKVLYVRTRGKSLFYNPGGKRELGESDEEALLREVEEELGVELVAETIQHAVTLSAQADGKAEGVMVVSTCYWAEYEGELLPSGEIEEMAWFTSADAVRTSAMGKLLLEWLHVRTLID